MLFFIRLYFKGNQNKLAKLKLSLTHSLLGDAIVSQINVREPLAEKKMFSFGHCPNEGGEGLARIKKYTLYIPL